MLANIPLARSHTYRKYAMSSWKTIQNDRMNENEEEKNDKSKRREKKKKNKLMMLFHLYVYTIDSQKE